MTREELEARISDARIPETTSTIRAVPTNLQFAGGPAQVDLAAGGQTRSRVGVTVTVPPSYDTGAAIAVLTGDDDTDEDFAYIVINRLSLQEALQQGDTLNWYQAIDSGVASLQYHQVFCQVDANQSSKIILTKIILVEKQNNQGKVERHKARLVAQVFFQHPGFDFDAEVSYAPTVDLTVLRLLLTKAASDDLAIWQYDDKTAYLRGELEEPVLQDCLKSSSSTAVSFDFLKICISALGAIMVSS